MADHCESCGKKLNEEEEKEGVCEKCKKSSDDDEEYERDEDFNDPAVTWFNLSISKEAFLVFMWIDFSFFLFLDKKEKKQEYVVLVA